MILIISTHQSSALNDKLLITATLPKGETSVLVKRQRLTDALNLFTKTMNQPDLDKSSIRKSRTSTRVMLVACSVLSIMIFAVPIFDGFEAATFLFLMAIAMIHQLSQYRRACPQCQQAFFAKGWLRNSLSKRCLHCGCEVN